MRNFFMSFNSIFSIDIGYEIKYFLSSSEIGNIVVLSVRLRVRLIDKTLGDIVEF